jgi:CRP/FNR family cyclic AMP-dependent transcriptional regulator
MAMGESIRNAARRTGVAQAITSRERKRANVIEEAPGPAKGGGFDVRAFLSFAGLNKKSMDFPKNKVVFAAGDFAENVLFIQKGIVKLSVTSGQGKTAVMTILGSGNFFGVWCLAGQLRRTATATTMAPTTVSVIPKEQMLRLLHSVPDFSDHFIAFLLKRNIRFGRQVVNFLFDSTEKKLIRALLFLAQFGIESGDDVTMFRVPQELLGEMIGTSRTHVNTFMTKLKRLGFIEYNGGLRIHRTPLMSLL